jgi:hypothetical protein
VTDEPKPPPGFSAFKAFMEKLVRVPKKEIDERERAYQEERAKERVKKGA